MVSDMKPLTDDVCGDARRRVYEPLPDGPAPSSQSRTVPGTGMFPPRGRDSRPRRGRPASSATHTGAAPRGPISASMPARERAGSRRGVGLRVVLPGGRQPGRAVRRVVLHRRDLYRPLLPAVLAGPAATPAPP